MGAQDGSGESPARLADWVRHWHPPEAAAAETLAAEPSLALAAVLDQPSPVSGDGDPIPPLWHWLHFLDRTPQAGLGPDGHPLDSAFLPPIPRRRRMFAGGRLEVAEPLRVGERVTRGSRVTSVKPKTGRGGELLLVTVEHRFAVEGRTRIVEEQDIMYRQGGEAEDRRWDASAESPQPEPGPWALRLLPTAAMLFRFSALTYNSHRIHYDYPYTTQVEGYPGLVVHGPLLALALLELPRRAGRRVSRYEFRLHRPAFCDRPVLLTGTPKVAGAELAAYSESGQPAATASAEFAWRGGPRQRP